MSNKNSSPQKTIPVQALIAFGIYLLLTPLILFGAAGRLNWPMSSRVVLLRLNPDLAQERGRHAEVEGVKAWDRALSAIVGVYGNFVILLVAGLDYRFGWSGTVPIWLAWLALLVGVGAYAFSTWAMIENQFFSAVVRIQTERNHTVCASGPYQIVRHPGYAGAAIFFLLMPLILGTLWAYIPVGLTLGALITRTILEDRTLQTELPGYAAFSQKTRYRLIPFIW